jgi:hypothetical protein
MASDWLWFPFPQIEDEPRFVRLTSQATAVLLALSLVYARSGQDWSGEPELLARRFHFKNMKVRQAVGELEMSGLWAEVKVFLDERVRRAGSGPVSQSAIRHPPSAMKQAQREQHARASERLKQIDEVRDLQWRPLIEKKVAELPKKERTEWEAEARQQLVARQPKAKSWNAEVLRGAIMPLLIKRFCQENREYEFGAWLSKQYPELAKEGGNEP